LGFIFLFCFSSIFFCAGSVWFQSDAGAVVFLIHPDSQSPGYKLDLHASTLSRLSIIRFQPQPYDPLHSATPSHSISKINQPNITPVFKQPLQIHSTQPLTGFTRTGYCTAPSSDAGNHSIAGVVSDAFLDFSAKRGNDLRSIGLTDGCKWCLCVNRWKEAFDARTGDNDPKVPKVFLRSTSERALEAASMDELSKFAVDKEGGAS
jgi:uncharacterized protein (DUF2237 family)